MLETLDTVVARLWHREVETMPHLSQMCLFAVMLGSFLLGACKSTERAPSVAGRDLYLRYCASCHGADAKGDGPVASTLQATPADLTTIAKRNAGRFDEGAVLATIDGRRTVAAHGPREMPVWGAVFAGELEGQAYPEYVNLLQSRSLVDYLRSVQEK